MLHNRRPGSPSDPVNIEFPGLINEDLERFCRAHNVEFFSLGCPEDWSDPSCFRVGTISLPSAGLTVSFSTVIDWKAASHSPDSEMSVGGKYKHCEGGEVVTVGEAIDDLTGAAMVIYRTESGAMRARHRNRFFDVVFRDGVHQPRFSFLGVVDSKGQVSSVAVHS